jgi:hypothetical protein
LRNAGRSIIRFGSRSAAPPERPARPDLPQEQIAWLLGGVSDTEIVERLGRQGIGPAPLSRCSLRASGHNGLMIGYTNVPKEHAASATRRMLAAMQGVR